MRAWFGAPNMAVIAQNFDDQPSAGVEFLPSLFGPFDNVERRGGKLNKRRCVLDAEVAQQARGGGVWLRVVVCCWWGRRCAAAAWADRHGDIPHGDVGVNT